LSPDTAPLLQAQSEDDLVVPGSSTLNQRRHDLEIIKTGHIQQASSTAIAAAAQSRWGDKPQI